MGILAEVKHNYFLASESPLRGIHQNSNVLLHLSFSLFQCRFLINPFLVPCSKYGMYPFYSPEATPFTAHEEGSGVDVLMQLGTKEFIHPNWHTLYVYIHGTYIVHTWYMCL